MSNPWFRLYAEFANDPKVQMMSEAYQRRLLMLFCFRCNGLVTLQDEEVTFQLRVSPDEWQQTKAVFVAKGFIDSDNNILNWDKRQFRSDSSVERVRKHRHAKKQEPVTGCNVTVTPPDTEQIQNRTEQKEGKKNKKKKNNGSRFTLTDLPSDWNLFCLEKRPDLDPAEVFAEFRDYWIAVPGQRGCKLDWFSTWRNRVRDKKRFLNGSDPPKTFDEIRKEKNNQAIEEARKRYV